MMKRTLEPELMTDERRARAYAQADFAESNQWFVDQFVADFVPALRHAVDLGCGPADVLIRLATAKPDVCITGIDGSATMIVLARAAVTAAGLEPRIKLIEGCIPGTPSDNHAYDAVLSKDALHHLPDPMVLWTEARRLGQIGAAVFVMDLVRPATESDARRIVEQVAQHEDPILKDDFFSSLCAAFTVAEVEKQLWAAGLDLAVHQVSERHMLVKGRL
jgi:ubiquinone/menaquinone biosynthesis C-methylase UbiE